jgi:hypothetical protein
MGNLSREFSAAHIVGSSGGVVGCGGSSSAVCFVGILTEADLKFRQLESASKDSDKHVLVANNHPQERTLLHSEHAPEPLAGHVVHQPEPVFNLSPPFSPLVVFDTL